MAELQSPETLAGDGTIFGTIAVVFTPWKTTQPLFSTFKDILKVVLPLIIINVVIKD